MRNTQEVKSEFIGVNYQEKIKLVDDAAMTARSQRKLIVEKAKLGPWARKANAYLQISQKYVSKNWH